MNAFPQVQGHCPACRREALILGAGGYVTCAHLDCPSPTAASDLLDQQGAAVETDGVYRERAQLVALLASLYPAVLAPAPDVEEPGWQIVYITLPTGQASWHISPGDAELFPHVPQVGADDLRARWDRHTTEEKYQRIRELYISPAGLFGGDRCDITLDVVTGGRKLQSRRTTPLLPADPVTTCGIVATELRAMAAEVEALQDPEEAR